MPVRTCVLKEDATWRTHLCDLPAVLTLAGRPGGIHHDLDGRTAGTAAAGGPVVCEGVLIARECGGWSKNAAGRLAGHMSAAGAGLPLQGGMCCHTIVFFIDKR